MPRWLCAACLCRVRKGNAVSTFGDDLIQSLGEALAHARDEGPTTVHAPVVPREVRKQAKLTQVRMAPPIGMSLSGYRKSRSKARDGAACV